VRRHENEALYISTRVNAFAARNFSFTHPISIAELALSAPPLRLSRAGEGGARCVTNLKINNIRAIQKNICKHRSRERNRASAEGGKARLYRNKTRAKFFHSFL